MNTAVWLTAMCKLNREFTEMYLHMKSACDIYHCTKLLGFVSIPST